MSDTNDYNKKLIEVALPLKSINEESRRDKYLSSGHPSTLHYWWAPRPLAACRAVVFASLVDDPSAHPERFPDEDAQEEERERLFKMIEKLVKWDNRKNRDVLEQARHEIARCTGDDPPKLFDPFCGRGLIPFEGQRLGLDVLASDLNPVPALITKTLVEIVPTFLSRPSVNPQTRKSQLLNDVSGAEGFAADVEFYAEKVLEEARPQLEDYYPEYEITPELVESRPDLEGLKGEDLTIMGWIWARTVECANPACRSTIPLTGTFWLSKKKEPNYWIEPEVEPESDDIHFHIRYGDGQAPDATKVPYTGGTFRCLVCGENTEDSHLKQEGKAGRIGKVLMACVADGGRSRGRVYLPPTEEHEETALSAEPKWRPSMSMPDYSQAMPTIKHGVQTWADLFTDRQLLTLDTLATSIRDLHDTIRSDAIEAGFADDHTPLEQGGEGAHAYADGIVTFLSLVLGKQASRSCTFNFWDNSSEKVQHPFAQQGIQKTWDFIESNPFSESSGSWTTAVDYPVRVIREYYEDIRPGRVKQQSVDDAGHVDDKVMIITDPPYYDNMGYADLSDFFYIWERRALSDIYPKMFGTMLTPKSEELAAVRHRFGGDRRKAEDFFVEGFRDAFEELTSIQRSDYPLCLFYAYKQKESRNGEMEASTGWETMLRGLIDSGLHVTGTWPILSEATETIKKNKSSLSTSVILVCRKRPEDAPKATKREFISALKAELPDALDRLQQSNIAPVDLAQASIGPGMAIFSRYSEVVEADGSAMSVRTALQLINDALDEHLTKDEGDYGADTRWALAWYDQFGFDAGDYGDAETLSTAKNTSVQGMVEAGILRSGSGKVRLLKRDEMNPDWRPSEDERLTVWEATQHLIHALEKEGEEGAAHLLAALQAESSVTAEAARDLAYRLYSLCERKDRTDEALAYNSLIVAWPQIERLAQERAEQSAAPQQGEFFE